MLLRESDDLSAWSVRVNQCVVCHLPLSCAAWCTVASLQFMVHRDADFRKDVLELVCRVLKYKKLTWPLYFIIVVFSWCVHKHMHIYESVHSHVYVCAHGNQELTLDVSPQVPRMLSFGTWWCLFHLDCLSFPSAGIISTPKQSAFYVESGAWTWALLLAW